MKTRKFKLTILIVVLTIVPFTANSQTKLTWANFSSNKNDYLQDLYENDAEEIYILGYQVDDIYYSKKTAVILKAHKTGEIIDTLKISLPSKSLNTSQIIKMAADTLLISGFASDTVTHHSAALHFYIINMDLNILAADYKQFEKNDELRNQFTAIGHNNDVLVTGTIVHNDSLPWRVFAYRLSKSLDSIQYKMFTDQPNLGTMGAEIKQIDTNIYFIHEGIQGFYYVTDSLFDIVSKQRIPKYVNMPFGIKWDSDTSFYLAGEWNDASDDDIAMFYQPNYADTSIQFFNWWGTTDTLDLTATYAMDYKSKDSIFIGGTSNFTINVFDELENWCFVLQTDSLLNIRWEKFVGGDANYRAQKILATKDGGCLIGTSMYDYQNVSEPQVDMRVFKLDQYGQLVGTNEISNIQTSEAIVYPNPGNEYLKIRIAAQHPKSVFALYSIDGKLLINKKLHGRHAEINASALKPGTYIYKIFNNKGLNESGKWVKE